ncbi:hypothetical protein DAEQUDRAFT_661282 [Daedalea quercina L-15889]|uniref:Protein N-terminal glutamine amidohydrolase n=1 Tax=Daedalea quercina L-15889 TaxID=1314783 RepID=A0A165TVE0_9APHY|nr:hypothetical protein DAEQUDRAFT_661282 [Daedalea quercina L-15889]
MPPPLPADSIYTSCYCEENIYILAQAFASKAEADADWPWQVFAVFISNHGKTVALWSQKAREDVVVWDYHVILVLRSRDHMQSKEQDPAQREDGEQQAEAAEDAWVYDFDTRLPVPSRWIDYVSNTFRYVFDGALFRVVPAAAYLDYFASDRSHMLKHAAGIEPYYSNPPPSYAILCGKRAKELGITNNLMDAYVSMMLRKQPPLEPEIRRTHGSAEPANPYGEVMSMSEFIGWLAGDIREDAQ